MKRFIGFLVVALIGVLSQVVPSYASATFSGGSGTLSDPYQIADGNQLRLLEGANLFLDKNFILTGDVNLGGNSIPPVPFVGIGTATNAFTGTFDGDGHKILGLSMQSALPLGEAAMFPLLLAPALIKDLEIFEPSINAGQRAGALAVETVGATVDNVHIVGGSVTSVGGWHVGGMIGSAELTSVANSSSSATVTIAADAHDHSCLGGLVGLAKGETTITSSYSTGPVNYSAAVGVPAYAAVGGLVGASFYSSISRSYSLGSVNSDSEFATSGVGGFVGTAAGGSLSENLAAGPVTDSGPSSGLVGSQGVGGFLGIMQTTRPDLDRNLWDKEKTGQTTDPANILNAPALGKVDPKTSAELTSLSTFTAAGWEFEAATGSDNYWVLLPTSYPTLSNRPFVNVPGVAIDPVAVPVALPSPPAPAPPAPTAYYSEPTNAPQASLSAKGKMTTLKRTSEISLEGGSGQGAVTYKSLTEAICAVDPTGVISGLAPGKCEVEVVKGAESFYTEAKTTMVVYVLTPYQKLGLAPEAITADEIQSIRGRYLSYLRSDLFQQLSTTALAALSSKQIKLITKRQFATLNQDQRKALKR